jgi:hypothetical protein
MAFACPPGHARVDERDACELLAGAGPAARPREMGRPEEKTDSNSGGVVLQQR